MEKYQTEKKCLYYDKVVSLYRDKHMGARRISKIIPVGTTTITNWIRIFVSENPEMRSLNMKHVVPPSSKSIEEPNQPPLPLDVKLLQREVVRLNKALRDASMRADLYDEMIEMAEKRFNISIRKKAGTKQ